MIRSERTLTLGTLKHGGALAVNATGARIAGSRPHHSIAGSTFAIGAAMSTSFCACLRTSALMLSTNNQHFHREDAARRAGEDRPSTIGQTEL